MPTTEGVDQITWSVTELVGAIRHQSCAESQRSGTFHKGYYGFWEGYEHDHHEKCCEIIEGIHMPRNR